jgi:hypothetical protein
MFTVARLIEIGEAAEKQYREFHGDETSDGRRKISFYREYHEAYACAEYMMDHGISELANIGMFHSLEIKRGQKVVVRKGATVYSYRPGHKERVSTRRQTVTVHNVDNGYVDLSHSPVKIRAGHIHWAGAGGYWCWCAFDDVECVVE